ncbi:hypothetical protein CBU_0457 [Coxiella burnetii RSA 493]|uniref:Uncharacterized protein n=1 Tax=Coxiella burnetii (strain RSA 493 / Nine Mile phase I) TaxID=227377 RepID=Q83E73_COXBU|nr:hypothetical protein CBU_0457 [Coxiella burnetii RSA 493]BBL37384.1 hypothetical protein CBU406_C14890 [Coxiella burnetii]BBL38261.1 hypothetical protein CBUVS42_C04360 [Coxiella burnetii]
MITAISSPFVLKTPKFYHFQPNLLLKIAIFPRLYRSPGA